MAVRKSSEALTVGDYHEVESEHDDVLMYERVAGEERVIVAVSFAAESVTVAVSGEVLVSTDLRDGHADGSWTLEPHGAVVIRA